MFGYGRGIHRGRFWPYAPVSAPEGYTYIGPCRCGSGPDAFYQDKSGTVVHASQLFLRDATQTIATEDAEAEVNQLRAEKADLEKRIKELEEHLKTKERKS
ncbi:MAG: hypothetical protein AB1393_06950 [Candidatus Edwardsbacteria bacterium]